MPLLLRMGELGLGLSKAVASADPELVALVILHAKGSLPASDLFELLLPHPVAQQLLVAYCEAREPELLKSFFYHADRPVNAAAVAVREAYQAEGWSERTRALSIALQFYQHNHPAKDAAGQQCAALARATEDQLSLLDVQRRLEGATEGLPRPPGLAEAVAAGGKRGAFRFVDAPLNETIYRCFCYRRDAEAERLRPCYPATLANLPATLQVLLLPPRRRGGEAAG